MHVIHLQRRKETHLLNIPLDNLKKLADKTKSAYFLSSDALEVLAILLIYAALFGSLAFCTMKILDLIAMLIKLEVNVRLFFGM